ncbi:hypothetical protein RHGRI_019858 [Rhododendron griersonianum]|uniref:Reverse transcriptase zinc-binding domain-containing protein n=1 Tax=Rhododendron griersonianum TaxID=479676 RepID=A0AAV6JEB2_9ERIC|nr:hypothetical protein RHGRI_019858 [Rhododendron griersonianum]
MVLRRKEEQLNWEFQLRRRRFFRGETEAFNSMVSMLDGLHIVLQPRADHLVWVASKSKAFTVSSMYVLATCQETNADNYAKKAFHLIWNNVSPYRVQCFGWMAYLGKLKTGDFLLRIGIIYQHHHALCKFCGETIESIDHSLLFCTPVWNVWCKILKWWGIQWVTPNSVSDIINWWLSYRQKPKIKVIWDCIPFAVLWSLWKMRNEHLFQNKDLNWEDVVDLIKLRIAFWVKTKWNDGDYSVSDFIFRLSSIIQAS